MALKTLHFSEVSPEHLHFSSIFKKHTVLKHGKTRNDNCNCLIWKRCAPGNNRDLSSQKCFNFRGVLSNDKTNCKTDTWELELSLGNFGSRISGLGNWAPEAGNQLTATGGTRGRGSPDLVFKTLSKNPSRQT